MYLLCWFSPTFGFSPFFPPLHAPFSLDCVFFFIFMFRYTLTRRFSFSFSRPGLLSPFPPFTCSGRCLRFWSFFLGAGHTLAAAFCPLVEFCFFDPSRFRPFYLFVLFCVNPLRWPGTTLWIFFFLVLLGIHRGLFISFSLRVPLFLFFAGIPLFKAAFFFWCAHILDSFYFFFFPLYPVSYLSVPMDGWNTFWACGFWIFGFRVSFFTESFSFCWICSCPLLFWEQFAASGLSNSEGRLFYMLVGSLVLSLVRLADSNLFDETLFFPVQGFFISPALPSIVSFLSRSFVLPKIPVVFCVAAFYTFFFCSWLIVLCEVPNLLVAIMVLPFDGRRIFFGEYSRVSPVAWTPSFWRRLSNWHFFPLIRQQSFYWMQVWRLFFWAMGLFDVHITFWVSL